MNVNHSPETPAVPGAGIQFTHLRAAIPISKTFELDPDGKLLKKTAPMPSIGTLTVRTVQSLEELADFIAGLTPYECIIWGTPKGLGIGDTQALTTQSRNKAGAIPRDREHFEFRVGQPTVLMLDLDPEDGKPADPIDEAYAKLLILHSAFKDVKVLAKHSAGGGIYNGDKSVREPRGIRFYALVTDGSLIPEIQTRLQKLSWVRGFGRWQISSAGRLLPRGLFDSSVGQPERIDFCGGAYCKPPLHQELSPARILNPDGVMLDGKALLDSPEVDSAAAAAMAAARPAAERDAAPIRASFEQDLRSQLAKDGIAADRIDAVLAGIDKDQVALEPEFPLLLDDGTYIKVQDLLDRPRLFDRRRLHDPLEPDYRGDSRIAIALLGHGEKVIFSHAHGGVRYLLTRPKIPIPVKANTDLAVIRDVARVLMERNAVFRRGRSIVIIDKSEIVPLTPQALVAVLSEHIAPWKLSAKGKESVTSFPLSLAAAWIDLQGEGLPELAGVLTAPIMLADGRILQSVGYDARSGLYLTEFDDSVQKIPEDPSDDDIRAALQTLWEPFSEFTFASDNDRSVLLALILTAFTRPAYPTAPAGLLTAPAQGHGKTLLATSLAYLAAGENVGVAPPVSGSHAEEELRKRLFAIARGGKAAVVYDNLEPGALASPGLCAYLTSGVIEDRVLGASKVEAVPFRVLFLMTGNNVDPEGDLPRRTLLCRLDAGVENAFQGRRFKRNPAEHCLVNRQAMAHAALTILQGYQKAGRPTFAPPFGSFEDWDRMVRQPLLWIQRQGFFSHSLGDPIAPSLEAAKGGTMLEALDSFLRWGESCFGDELMTASEISSKIRGSAELSLVRSPDDPLLIREELRRAALEGLVDLRVASKDRDGNIEIKTSKLSGFFKAYRDRVVDGRQIAQSSVKGRDGRWSWGVKRVR